MTLARRISLLALLAIAAGVIATTAARGVGGAPLRVADAGAAFPERSLVLTLPRPLQLRARDVLVLENGDAVHHVSVAAAGTAAPGRFAAVLVVDASNSMAGQPLADALAAARAFAAARPPHQSLGLVTFNVRALVALRPTTDPGAIRDALSSRPRLAEGTRLRDAADRAVALLRQSRSEAGSVVLLSDGADTGSSISADALAELARRAHVRIFAVALRSPQFAPDQLRAIATRTGGLYTEASSSRDLGRIYAALGARLANEYLVHYRSDADPSRRVRVTVRIPALGANGTATLTYTTPAIPGGGAFHQSLGERFFVSRGSVALVALAAALLAALAATLLVHACRPSLIRRLADFVPSAAPSPAPTAHRAVTRLGESLARVRGWNRFRDDVEIARLPVDATTLFLATAATTFVVAVLPAIAAAQPALLLLGIAPPLAARAWVRRRVGAVRRHFEEQLADMLQVLASALRAGHGLSSALGVVAVDMPEPTRGELDRARSDERLGVSLEEALTTVARRMESGDLEQVALITGLHRETGGNTAEVLDRVHDTVRERFELRRLADTLTAQGRMARWILTGLPVAVGLAVAVINPGYARFFWTTTAGFVVFAVAIAMVTTGSLLVKRIVEIEV